MYKKEKIRFGEKTIITKKIIKKDEKTQEPIVEESISERDRYIELKTTKCCCFGINL